MKCIIFCSAQIDDYSYLRELDINHSFVICADGGMKHADALGIIPDVWLGDGDSLKDREIRAKEIVKFPSRKDNTDTDLAIELALDRGFRDIAIIGGIGGRIDHEFSHFCLLKKILDRGGNGCLLDEKNEITMKNQDFVIYPDKRKYISFFPFGGDVENFSVKGLRYETDGVTLRSGEVLASSNCFDDGTSARIEFDSGYLLVIRAED